MKPKLSFVIVTWNSDGTIGECLDSISRMCAKEKISYEVKIVDNGSTDRTLSVIADHSDMPLDTINFKKNEGTTKTRNIALRHVSGDYVCVLDSDAALMEGSLKKIFDTLDSDVSIGVLAPKLVYGDGEIQVSAHKFPSLYSKLIRVPKIIFRLSLNEIAHYPLPFDNVTEIDYAISACWFMRRNTLGEVGLFDEKIFYGPEDLEYCLRLWKKHKKTVYYPYLTVKHHCQRIVHRNWMSYAAFGHFYSVIYTFLKHCYFKYPSRCEPFVPGPNLS